ncbi:MAG: RHS repeat-associated core domain-containing protein [Pseudomonadota bacterium]|nr:RHS repeat-associated core domain-containing protein [Pseudomonadota bacterium]
MSAGGDTQITSYSFDALNRLGVVADSQGQTLYTYDAVGNRESVSYPSGNVTLYDYDALNRLTRLTTTDAADQILADYAYTLDATGRRAQVQEAHSGRTTSYSYDELYRLTGETITDPVNGNYSAAYQFDKVGNRTYSIINGVHTAYSYDNNDRLTEQGGVSYRYDANGNTLSETEDGLTTRYHYDARNKLIEVEKPGLTASYGYNADGIRTRKTENGITTHYVVDSNRDYAQVLEEVTNRTAEVSYTYGDDLVSQTRAGSASYYLYDGHGSTRGLADQTGSLTDSYDYDAFGVLLNSTGDTKNVYRYTGEQVDWGLDQYYLRARYYDQSSGRFTQMDTWMGRNSDPVTLNKYLYGNADPTTFIDPSGHFGITMFAPSNISLQMYSASVGEGALGRVAVGLLEAGVVGYTVSSSVSSMIESSPTAQKILELQRIKLESRVEKASRNRPDLVYHYTDRVSARAIMAMQCAYASKGFSHPDGNYRPSGVYATRLHAWIAGWAQSDLRAVIYAKPNKQDVSHFVAVEDSGFVHAGVESYKRGPRGSCVPVTAVYSGANLMLPN